jgi:RNA polymerase sigma factor (sigma-70 family)
MHCRYHLIPVPNRSRPVSASRRVDLKSVDINDFVKRAACAEKYKPMIQALARSVVETLPPSIELDDLIQAGELALWEATAKFSAARAATFASYVRVRIHGAMVDSVKGKEYREATHEELTAALMVVPCRRPTIEKTLIEREEENERALRLRKKFQIVQRAMADVDPKFFPLSKKQQRVVSLRFDHHYRTQKQAGRVMRISQQASQELEHRAIGNLKKKLAGGGTPDRRETSPASAAGRAACA